MTFKWGIIGYGWMGRTFSADLRQVANCELIGYYSGEHNYSIPLDQLLTQADIIYIATPHHLHYHYTKLALHAGCHTLCEKPLTLSVRDAEELIHLARDRNIVLMEGMWMKFLPAFEQLEQEISKIGALNALQVNFSFPGNREANSRLIRPECGGGAIYDVGIYPLTLLDFLVDDYKQISSSMALEKTDVDLSIHLGFSSKNFVAQISASYGFNTPNYALIWGEHGVIELAPPFWKCPQLVISALQREPVTIATPYSSNGYTHEIISFIDTIKRGEIDNDIHSHQACLRVLQLLEDNSPLHLKHKISEYNVN